MSNEKMEDDSLDQLIEDLLKNNPGPHYSSEIADALGSGYIVTFNAVKRLLKEGRVKKAERLPTEPITKSPKRKQS